MGDYDLRWVDLQKVDPELFDELNRFGKTKEAQHRKDAIAAPDGSVPFDERPDLVHRIRKYINVSSGSIEVRSKRERFEVGVRVLPGWKRLQNRLLKNGKRSALHLKGSLGNELSVQEGEGLLQFYIKR